jgi:hypothetical protein
MTPRACRLWRALVAATAGLGLGYGCASHEEEGSESNFLQCRTDADCEVSHGAGFTCRAGACMQALELTGAVAQGDAGSCVPSSCPSPGFGRTCCVAPEGPCGLDTGFGCEPTQVLRCYDTADCPGAFVCDLAAGECVQCLLDDGCTAPGAPWCRGDTHQCVECLADAYCPAGAWCAANRCIVPIPYPAEAAELPACGSVVLTVSGSDIAGNSDCSIVAPAEAQEAFRAGTLNVWVEGMQGSIRDGFALVHASGDDYCELGSGWIYQVVDGRHEVLLCDGICWGSMPETVSLLGGCGTASFSPPLCPDTTDPIYGYGARVAELDDGGCELVFDARDALLAAGTPFAVVYAANVWSLVPQVAGDDSAACERVIDGWYLDDPASPTRILLCPQTCRLSTFWVNACDGT